MKEERRVVSTRIERRLCEMLREEAVLRGHTFAEALEKIISLGVPLYLKKYQRKYRRIEEPEDH